MRLIDADRLCENCKDFPQCMGEFKAECAVYVDVAAQPTIDPESLRPKGEWVMGDYYDCGDVCSVCDWDSGGDCPDYNYCPNCGADMRGEKDG